MGLPLSKHPCSAEEYWCEPFVLDEPPEEDTGGEQAREAKREAEEKQPLPSTDPDVTVNKMRSMLRGVRPKAVATSPVAVSLRPEDYNFGPESCYAMARAVTCRGGKADEARKMWARAYVFMLNYNHEEGRSFLFVAVVSAPSC